MNLWGQNKMLPPADGVAVRPAFWSRHVVAGNKFAEERVRRGSGLSYFSVKIPSR